MAVTCTVHDYAEMQQVILACYPSFNAGLVIGYINSVGSDAETTEVSVRLSRKAYQFGRA
jgi:hypothetical protein